MCRHKPSTNQAPFYGEAETEGSRVGVGWGGMGGASQRWQMMVPKSPSPDGHVPKCYKVLCQQQTWCRSEVPLREQCRSPEKHKSRTLMSPSSLPPRKSICCCGSGAKSWPTPWTTARLTSQSSTSFQSSPRFMFIASVTLPKNVLLKYPPFIKGKGRMRQHNLPARGKS